jgi:hypothetical protein
MSYEKKMGDTGLEPVTPSLSSNQMYTIETAVLPEEYRHFSNRKSICKPLHQNVHFLGKQRYRENKNGRIPVYSVAHLRAC